MAVHRFPIEAPDRTVAARLEVGGGEVGPDQRREAPVEQPGGQPVVAGHHQQLPLACPRLLREGTRVAHEVAEDVALELALAVRRLGAAETVEAGEDRTLRVAGAAIEREVATPAARRLGLLGRRVIDELAEAVEGDLLHASQSPAGRSLLLPTSSAAASAITAPKVKAKPAPAVSHSRPKSRLEAKTPTPL